MRALTGEEILAAWECCVQLPEQRAALTVLALADPERDASEWGRLPLGERNALLLDLRTATLGRRMEGFALCPECGAELEFAFDAGELARDLRAQAGSALDVVDGCSLRPANTLDLLAASAGGDEEQARRILLERTVSVKDAGPRADGGPADGESRRWLSAQSEPVFARLLQAFEALNASAEIRAQFQCAACGSSASVDVDVAHFFLGELARSARWLMMDVHDLASAYGWSEQSIVAMSAARRSAYLELLRA